MGARMNGPKDGEPNADGMPPLYDKPKLERGGTGKVDVSYTGAGGGGGVNSSTSHSGRGTRVEAAPPHCASHRSFQYDCLDCQAASAEIRRPDVHSSRFNSQAYVKSIDRILRTAYRRHPLSQANRLEWERFDMLVRHTLDMIKELQRKEVPGEDSN